MTTGKTTSTPRHLAWALAAALLVAGCLGGEEVEPAEDESGDEGPVVARATATTGAIRGTIANDLYEPLGGAEVLLLDGGRTERLRETIAAGNGTFAFNDLKPGTYVVQGRRLDYRTTAIATQVEAGAVTPVHLRLVPLPPVDPYVIETDLVGLMTNGRAYHIEVPGQGCLVVPGQHQDLPFDEPLPQNVTTGPTPSCGKRIQYNSQNWRGEIETDNESKTIVLEVAWRPAGLLGEHLWIDMYCNEVYHVGVGGSFDFGLVSDPEHPCYLPPESQTSPVLLRVDEPHWLEHGYNHTLWHWRVLPGHGTLGTYPLIGVDVGLAYEQPYTLYISVFQRAPAPADFSRVPE